MAIKLYCDEGCPFATRVRLLLGFLQVPHEVIESPHGQKPEGVGAYSATERIPLLVDDDLVLTESRVMLRYLAEREDWPGLPADLGQRYRHLQTLAVVDDYVVPRLFVPPDPADRPRFDETLGAVAVVCQSAGPISLLSFHLAGLWIFASEHSPDSSFAEAAGRHPGLVAWLDRAVQLTRTTTWAGRTVGHS